MSAVLEPSSEVSAPRDEIHRFMIQRISRYLSSSDDTSLYQSVRKISQFISDDYGNRFLVELIQNAHDAHEPSSWTARSPSSCGQPKDRTDVSTSQTGVTASTGAISTPLPTSR